MEGKKTKFDMAEYDGAFIYRILGMQATELMAYLHSLSPVERQAMQDAILRAVSQEAVKEHIEELYLGLMD